MINIFLISSVGLLELLRAHPLPHLFEEPGRTSTHQHLLLAVEQPRRPPTNLGCCLKESCWFWVRKNTCNIPQNVWIHTGMNVNNTKTEHLEQVIYSKMMELRKNHLENTMQKQKPRNQMRANTRHWPQLWLRRARTPLRPPLKPRLFWYSKRTLCLGWFRVS